MSDLPSLRALRRLEHHCSRFNLYLPKDIETQPQAAFACVAIQFHIESGGADRDRTDDILLAKQALSQLSYSPMRFSIPET